MSINPDKLRALRRQAGGQVRGTPAPPAVTAAAPRAVDAAAAGPAPPRHTSIESLRRLLGVRERKPAYMNYPAGPIDRALPGEEIAPGLRLIQSHVAFPAPTTTLALDFAKRHGEAVDPRHLLFFDTETTGLAGGTGTRAFQIGAADWHHDPVHGDGLRIRQLLITTLAAEPLMLQTFTDWLGPDTVLSSYNGRCYDAPLLKTRYRLARMGDPITGLDHVDLLFPTRRRYRGVWENCRLATIERELLGIVREDDLPGSEAPAAWLSYLRGGPSSLLRRVCAHNHQDVVTLAQLILRLVDAEAEAAGEVFTAS
ncbi:ribonuclease H-like domain-containing protein [Lysobacter ciconiae]|uniref:Ribonuclease H-like domain-containing protein n=1 Tax=Novilysobacter ciconiae TaxID=2781022 RepID=A0A7S6UFX5_9GAMM|nr:ribonuclease H-like domain-containing protein [Lysobacter ciconiae]QOW19571.1 ribonuclease H-like domain-containing protein [Lysobacter ciconiae]